MHTSHITILNTGRFSKLVNAYVAWDKNIHPFYTAAPKLDSFQEQIQIKKEQYSNAQRDALVTVLKEQYANLEASEPVLNNIEALKDPHTFTVSSGHQLRVFLGPLYFIYKIITTINLAEQLNARYKDNHFVPVFWLEGEDHDFEEINHIHVFNKKISWNTNQKGAVGKFNLKGLSAVMDELDEMVGSKGKGQDILSIFRKAYENHDNLALATQAIVHQLFKDFGLVTFNPDSKVLKEFCKGIFKNEVLEQGIYKNISPTLKKLRKHYKIQANPREINLFYMMDGYRERLVNDSSGFATNDGKHKFSSQELEKEIESHPERFSPNVLCRPLVQEQMLPNLAYVGGGAEVAYWAELKEVFESFKIPFPLIFLRNSAMYVDASSQKTIDKLGLQINDLFGSADDVVGQFLEKEDQGGVTLDSEKKEILKTFQKIKDQVKDIDTTLEGHIGAESQKVIKIMEGIESKMRKSAKSKVSTQIDQIQKLHGKLFPDNVLQERVESLISVYDKEGHAFIDLLKDNLDPFGKDLLIVFGEI